MPVWATLPVQAVRLQTVLDETRAGLGCYEPADFRLPRAGRSVE